MEGKMRNLGHSSGVYPVCTFSLHDKMMILMIEFKFWYSATKANAIALLCTITRATDVPVYWPILLIYFLTLFGLTMRRQIQSVHSTVILGRADK
jgi:hypothetical protein